MELLKSSFFMVDLAESLEQQGQKSFWVIEGVNWLSY